MSALPNAKHERFAQALAKGKTADDAYVEAGYKPSRANASTLKAKQSISARVAELLERSAARTEITVASITERLLAIAAKGEQTEEAPMLSVARASLMDAAKLNGLIVDKQELDHRGGVAITKIERVIVDASNPNAAGVPAAS